MDVVESVTWKVFKNQLNRVLSNLVDPVLSMQLSQKPEVPLNLKDFMSCLLAEGFGPLKRNFNLLILKSYIGNINVDLFLIKLMSRYVLPPRTYRI